MIWIHQLSCESEHGELKNKRVNVFFGDATNAIDKQNLALAQNVLWPLKDQLGIARLVLLHQVHGSHVHTFSKAPYHDSIGWLIGDGLITNQPGLGLAVLTADCVPVILYSRSYSAVAIVHAGWKGTLAGVVQNTVRKFIITYRVEPKDLYAILGPSAGLCCYEFGPEIYALIQAAGISLSVPAVMVRGLKRYLNVPLLVRHQLEQAGLPSVQIQAATNECTICSTQYCSFRRGDLFRRQISLVVLPTD